jgi:SAM-dependent methyltransferase
MGTTYRVIVGNDGSNMMAFAALLRYMSNMGTIDTYQSSAEEYSENNADRSVIEELVSQFLAVVQDATDKKSARIIDVGCGPGWESSTFAAHGHDAVGIDLTPAFVQAARREIPAASFARMDMRHLSFATDSFDGLWACASFLHVPRNDALATLGEFHRVLRPEGVAHISVKRGDGEMRGNTYEDDQRRFTLYQLDELRAKAAEVGFTVTSADAGPHDGNDWVLLFLQA